MSTPEMVVICTDPAVLDAWSGPLIARAGELDIAIGRDEATTDPSGLVISTDPYDALTVVNAVLLQGPQSLTADDESLGVPETKDAVQLASYALMQMTMLAQDRAPVFDAMQPSIDLPRLGAVDADGPRLSRPKAPGPLSIYDRLPPQPGAKAFWPGPLLRYPTRTAPDGGPTRINLMGRPRILVHGPYVTVIPGHWRASIEIEVDADDERIELGFEWGIDPDMTEAPVVITESGRYSLTLDHTSAVSGPAQLRVTIPHAVFGGRLEIIGVTVELIEVPSAPQT